jgi:hypothetical protein
VIISDKLSNDETQRLVATLEKYWSVIGYSLKNLKGISLSLCTHCIPMEQDHKPVGEHQRRLNNAMREVVKKGLKLLKAGVIYPVLDSEWVSPVQVVLKKGGMIVIHNEKNKLIPQQTVIPRSEKEGTKPPYVCPGCSNHTYSNNMITRFHVQ